MTSEKPFHLTSKFGDRFQSTKVAQAYTARPPYPDEVFEILGSLVSSRPVHVLELGCGTGDLSLRLAPLVDRLDAIDPSTAMLKVARSMPGADHPSLQWIECSAEAFDYGHAAYDMIVAAEAFHWFDWSVLAPKIESALTLNGYLVIIEGRSGWLGGKHADELLKLIRRYSTMPDYVEVDLINELQERGLFKASQRISTKPITFKQSIEEFCLALHSSSSLSVDAMGIAAAKAFDAELGQLLELEAHDGFVSRKIVTKISVGRPLSSQTML